MSMEKLTDSGRVKLATISFDGHYLFNVHDDGQGTQSLWMRHIVTGSNKEILAAVETRYTGLTVSPDDSYVYFVRIEPQRPDLGLLYQIPVLGGTPRLLVTDVDSAVSFSPDGKQIVFLRNSTADGDSKLIITDANGSNERVLAKLPLPGYRDPAWSPDGKTIAASVIDPGGASLGRIVGLDPNTGQERTIYSATALLGKPTWLPDGKTIAMVFQDVSTNWDGQIGEAGTRSGKFRRITNDLNSYNPSSLAVTADGKQLVAVESTPHIGLYVMSSEPNAQAPTAPIDTLGDTSVGWTPDGRLVVIDYDGHIATLNADGSNRTVLYAERLFMQGLSVCDDGQHALFDMPNKQTKGLSVYLLDLKSANVKPLTSGKADQHAVCAPDSKYFLYTKLDNGKQTLMRMPLEGGEAKQLYDGFVNLATISPDGLQVALLTLEGAGSNASPIIRIISPDGGPPLKTIQPSRLISGAMQFSADGKDLYYPVNPHSVSNIVRQSREGGGPVAVTNFDDLLMQNFSYDWKNKKLAVSRGRSNTDVVLIKEHKSE